MADFDLLVRVSRFYYELGETQERIAGVVGVTRPQVSRLLKQARAGGQMRPVQLRLPSP